MNARMLIITGVTATGFAAAGLLYYFNRVGLDQADKTASVLGVFLALAGLVLTAYGIFESRNPATAEPNQSVSGSTISGTNIQIGRTGGSVRVHNSHQNTPPHPPAPIAPEASAASGDHSGQSVQGSQISGMNLQIGTATGEVEVNE
ncbi:hypothetical protein ACIRO3_10255 [Streptomyces sp. NPDC102278]|uniref:hypothetical protein n=1 Tax=Streptomyces sp. NPDC102278 TaxID=3366152 RepID=UPI003825432A